MSLTISGGGGGGGITIETDPTALKIASNLSDLADPNQAIVNLGALGDAPNDGTVYGRQSGEWVQTGGSGIAIDSTNTGYIQLNGGGGGVVLGYDLLNNLSGFSEIFVNFEGAGTRITTSGITFPDNTVQTTAYTGGGGGGSSLQQRYADAIATLIGETGTNHTAEVGIQISAFWTHLPDNSHNWSLASRYPAFFGYMSSDNMSVAIYADGDYFPVSYMDAFGFQTSTPLNGDTHGTIFYSPVQIAVTSTAEGGGFTDSQTTALSFQCGETNS